MAIEKKYQYLTPALNEQILVSENLAVDDDTKKTKNRVLLDEVITEAYLHRFTNKANYLAYARKLVNAGFPISPESEQKLLSLDPIPEGFGLVPVDQTVSRLPDYAHASQVAEIINTGLSKPSVSNKLKFDIVPEGQGFKLTHTQTVKTGTTEADHRIQDLQQLYPGYVFTTKSIKDDLGITTTIEISPENIKSILNAPRLSKKDEKSVNAIKISEQSTKLDALLTFLFGARQWELKLDEEGNPVFTYSIGFSETDRTEFDDNFSAVINAVLGVNLAVCTDKKTGEHYLTLTEQQFETVLKNAGEKGEAAKERFKNTFEKLQNQKFTDPAKPSHYAVKKFVTAFPDQASEKFAYKKGATPLSIAVVAGDVDAVHTLISMGADVNAQDGKGNIPMGWAFWQLATLKQFSPKQPLSAEVLDRYCEIAIILMRAGSNLEAEDTNGATISSLFNNEYKGASLSQEEREYIKAKVWTAENQRLNSEARKNIGKKQAKQATKEEKTEKEKQLFNQQEQRLAFCKANIEFLTILRQLASMSMTRGQHALLQNIDYLISLAGEPSDKLLDPNQYQDAYAYFEKLVTPDSAEYRNFVWLVNKHTASNPGLQALQKNLDQFIAKHSPQKEDQQGQENAKSTNADVINLQMLMQDGDFERAIEKIVSNKALVNAVFTDPAGATPLTMVICGQPDASMIHQVQRILALNPALNTHDGKNNTPLGWVIIKAGESQNPQHRGYYLEIAKLLIKAGASFENTENYGLTTRGLLYSYPQLISHYGFHIFSSKYKEKETEVEITNRLLVRVQSWLEKCQSKKLDVPDDIKNRYKDNNGVVYDEKTLLDDSDALQKIWTEWEQGEKLKASKTSEESKKVLEKTQKALVISKKISPESLQAKSKEEIKRLEQQLKKTEKELAVYQKELKAAEEALEENYKNSQVALANQKKEMEVVTQEEIARLEARAHQLEAHARQLEDVAKKNGQQAQAWQSFAQAQTQKVQVLEQHARYLEQANQHLQQYIATQQLMLHNQHAEILWLRQENQRLQQQQIVIIHNQTVIQQQWLIQQHTVVITDQTPLINSLTSHLMDNQLVDEAYKKTITGKLLENANAGQNYTQSHYIQLLTALQNINLVAKQARQYYKAYKDHVENKVSVFAFFRHSSNGVNRAKSFIDKQEESLCKALNQKIAECFLDEDSKVKETIDTKTFTDFIATCETLLNNYINSIEACYAESGCREHSFRHYCHEFKQEMSLGILNGIQDKLKNSVSASMTQKIAIPALTDNRKTTLRNQMNAQRKTSQSYYPERMQP